MRAKTRSRNGIAGLAAGLLLCAFGMESESLAMQEVDFDKNPDGPYDRR